MTQTHAAQAAHIERQFGIRAEAYVSSDVHAKGADLHRLIQVLEPYRGGVMLDLGCGGGHVSFTAAPLMQHVVACDLSSRMLEAAAAEAARRGLHQIETVSGTAEALPFADHHFDVVVSRYSAHHWPDFEAGLRQAYRVLKPGGLAVFMDTAGFAEAAADTVLQSIELLRDPSHVRNRTLAEWVQALGRAGFSIEDARSDSLVMDFAAWLARMATPPVHEASIRALLACLPHALRTRLGVQDEAISSWAVPIVFLIARRAA
ncbi:class I SAM-dependent methyltransferase [Granulibacter bethesdensis]|nr:class I SAM-dependent methyltransferase [Granulibacter bethesdensis]